MLESLGHKRLGVNIRNLEIINPGKISKSTNQMQFKQIYFMENIKKVTISN